MTVPRPTAQQSTEGVAKVAVEACVDDGVEGRVNVAGPEQEGDDGLGCGTADRTTDCDG
jgi:hypothetical protein